jgi:hypothetical protein
LTITRRKLDADRLERFNGYLRLIDWIKRPRALWISDRERRFEVYTSFEKRDGKLRESRRLESCLSKTRYDFRVAPDAFLGKGDLLVHWRGASPE